jgi:hypothetical protein
MRKERNFRQRSLPERIPRFGAASHDATNLRAGLTSLTRPPLTRGSFRPPRSCTQVSDRVQLFLIKVLKIQVSDRVEFLERLLSEHFGVPRSDRVHVLLPGVVEHLDVPPDLVGSPPTRPRYLKTAKSWNSSTNFLGSGLLPIRNVENFCDASLLADGVRPTTEDRRYGGERR